MEGFERADGRVWQNSYGQGFQAEAVKVWVGRRWTRFKPGEGVRAPRAVLGGPPRSGLRRAATVPMTAARDVPI